MYSLRRQDGALMIEVLVTIAIIIIGVLGLMQLQSRLQKSEVESYQRTQALILVSDMASRIATNRANADNYTTDGTPLGVGTTCPGVGTTLQEADSREWCLSLQGAAETISGSSVGAMVGGRGCVEEVTGDNFMVTVVWQGLTPISAADPNSISCGANLYNLPVGSDCVDDTCRRWVTSQVRLADLTVD